MQYAVSHKGFGHFTSENIGRKCHLICYRKPNFNNKIVNVQIALNIHLHNCSALVHDVAAILLPTLSFYKYIKYYFKPF